MKKKLSLALAFVMIVAVLSVVLTPTAYANDGDGMWTTMGSAKQYEEDFFDNKNSISGYEYTEEGFHTIPADWSTSLPYVTVQSKEKVDLKQGVYMEIRIDEFSYEASDSWFNLHIWDSVNLTPGCQGYGEGVQAFLRPSNTGPALQDDEPIGSVASITWYTESFTNRGSKSIDTVNRRAVKSNSAVKDVFVLEISWVGESYEVMINGTYAPYKVTEYMNDKFADGEAYIGFTMQNYQKDGAASATITKFGTCKEDAVTPAGTDYAEPVNYYNVYSDIMDPSSVPESQPAIFMTGSLDSDLKGISPPLVGNTAEITENGTIKVTSQNAVVSIGPLKVDNEISYDVADFPILMCVTKNLCACKMETHVDCLALECLYAYVLTGDEQEPAHVNKVREFDMCYDPIIIGKDNYLYFWLDLRELGKDGRFNGVRFDIPGFNYEDERFDSFELLWTGLFRTQEEAQLFALNYFEEIANPDGLPDTETTETETETLKETGPSDTDRVMSSGIIYAENYASVNVNQNYYGKIFTFVPERSGRYRFMSMGRYGTVGYILDTAGKTLGHDEKADDNFSIELWLVAGETYYLCTEMYDANQYGSYNVSVSYVQGVNIYITEGAISTETEINSGWDSDELASYLESNDAFEGETDSDEEGERESYMALDGCLLSSGFGGSAIVFAAIFGAAICVRRKKD